MFSILDRLGGVYQQKDLHSSKNILHSATPTKALVLLAKYKKEGAEFKGDKSKNYIFLDCNHRYICKFLVGTIYTI